MYTYAVYVLAGKIEAMAVIGGRAHLAHPPSSPTAGLCWQGS